MFYISTNKPNSFVLLAFDVSHRLKHSNMHCSQRANSVLFHIISFGTQSFSSVSAKIWNVLMVQIDGNVSLVIFKQSLKLYLLNNTLVISYSK